MQKYQTKYYVLVALSLAVFVMGFFIATDIGTSLKYSSDSIWIRSLAENFRAGNGLTGLDGDELIYWVPLYPLILSLSSENFDLFALIINFFAIIGVFILASLTYHKEQELANGKLFYSTSLLLSTPLLMISVFLWTETVFLFLLLLFVYGLNAYLESQNKFYLIIWLISGWLMLVLRNAGIFFIPGILIWITIQKNRTLNNKITLISLILLMCSGFLTWNIYKIIIQSNLNVLTELIPVFKPLNNVLLISNEIGKYIIPDIGYYLSGLVGAGLLGYLIYRAVKLTDSLIGLNYFMILTYLFTFVIIPPDPSEISRYLAPVIPFVFIASTRIMSLFYSSKKINPWISGITILGIYSYFFIRIIKNSFVWGHIDFYNYFTFAWL